MALGTITVTNDLRPSASAPLGSLELSFPGDGAYLDGGTALQDLVRAAVGRAVTILCVMPVGLNGGYRVIYDKANDKLVLAYYDYNAGADGPAIQVANGNYSGTTFKVLVLYY
jgi:hypothetical protein